MPAFQTCIISKNACFSKTSAIKKYYGIQKMLYLRNACIQKRLTTEIPAFQKWLISKNDWLPKMIDFQNACFQCLAAFQKCMISSKCIISRDAWFPKMHDFQKCIISKNAWFPKIPGFQKCLHQVTDYFALFLPSLFRSKIIRTESNGKLRN